MNRHITRSALCALLTIPFVLINGCVNTPKGYVAKEWSTTLRELSIVPVFPPREDVQVGDIYAAPSRPEDEEMLLKKEGFLPIGVWVATINLTNELTKFYANRASFPRTSGDLNAYASGLSTNPFAVFPQPADTNRNIFQFGDTNRLRLVGFPSFMSATFKQADLAGVVPVEALSVAFAASGSSSDSVTLSVPVAESYGLPSSDIYHKILLDPATNKFLLANSYFRPQDVLVYTAQQQKGVVNPNNPSGYFRVITEVFYTRAVDLSINRKKSFGAGANVKPIVSIQSTNITASSTTNSSSTNYLFTTRTEAGSPQDRAAELNRQLTESLNQSTPGGSVKFVSAGEYGVTMRRTYDRPVAIGYRALLLRIYGDGTIESAGSVGSMIPTAR